MMYQSNDRQQYIAFCFVFRFSELVSFKEIQGKQIVFTTNKRIAYAVIRTRVQVKYNIA